MQKIVCSAVLVLLSGPVLAPAAYAADKPASDLTTVKQMAEKAESAKPQEQCYLYARLVRDTTELASHDATAGDGTAAEVALNLTGKYIAALQDAVAVNAKKLKDAEILLRESAFHLKAAMHASAVNQRPAMAMAIDRINAAESQVMRAVFAR